MRRLYKYLALSLLMLVKSSSVRGSLLPEKLSRWVFFTREQRIGVIGGQTAECGEFPSLVSIQSLTNDHFCAGNVIDENHVLTVAHCMALPNGKLIDKSMFHLVAGDTAIRCGTNGPNRVYRTVSHIFIHPNYNGYTHVNDIAVLRVSEPFPIIRGVLEPIPLADSLPIEGERCTVAGWGTVDPINPTMPKRLQRVEVSIQNIHECNRTYDGLLRQGMICAGTQEGGRDACQGDSGGGLVCKYSLTGLVAFGKGCARPGVPGVYTDIIRYIEWINTGIRFVGCPSEVPLPLEYQPSPFHKIINMVLRIASQKKSCKMPKCSCN